MTLNPAICQPSSRRAPPPSGAAVRHGRRAQRGHLDRAAHQPAAQPRDAVQVRQGGGHDVDPGVGVVDPVHRDLVDAQASPFGQHEQLGVEEPAGVLGERQQRPRLVVPDRLETALRVGEFGAERGAQQQVVTPRDHLAPGSPDHPRTVREPGPDGDVAVPGKQRGHQRQKRVEIGGQIDVHIGEHIGVARGPDSPQRAAPPRLVQMNGRDVREFPAERHRDRPGAVGAAVVGNGHARREREFLPQVGAEPPDARSQIAFLVLHRDDDVHLGCWECAISHRAPGFRNDVEWLHAGQLRLPQLADAERLFCAPSEIFN